MEERLQKLLSACGLASRRTAEAVDRGGAGHRQWDEGPRWGTGRTWTGTSVRGGWPAAPARAETGLYLMLNKPRGLCDHPV